MKKRIFLFVAIVAVIACLFAISVSADSINPSSSNAFGTLTTFDDPIGNTNISPNKDDGTVARAVIFDGTKYYTVPSVYLLTENYKNYNGQTGEMLYFSFSEITSKLGVTINKNSIIRFEVPSGIVYVAGGGGDIKAENFSNCTNAIEIVVNDGLRFWSDAESKIFTHCENLVSIDVSNMVIEYPKCAFAMFEYCYKLESVVLPNAYPTETGFVNYDTDHMFSGCNKLESVENAYNFFKGVTSLGYKTFYNCYVLPEAILWEGLVTIEGRAFGNCRAIKSVIIPSTVSTIGTTETTFEACTSLKKIVFPNRAVSLGDYCFEKCSALTDVWMPGTGSTFGKQVFGQCGSDLAVNFYFTTATNTISIPNAEHNRDPFITALNNNDTTRLKYNTPLSTKCTVFLGGHTLPTTVNSCTNGGACTVCATAFAAIATSHDLVTTLTYPNGFAKAGVKATVCQNWEKCTVENASDAVDAIFTSVGYSYREDASRSGLTSGFSLNRDALEEFIAFNPDADLVVSLFIVSPTKLTGENFFVNGVLAAEKGIQVDISALEYDNYNYFVSGFTVAQMQSAELVFGMLVCNGEYEEVIQKQYAQGEESTTKAVYTDAKGFALNSVTVQSVDPEMVEALLPKQD